SLTMVMRTGTSVLYFSAWCGDGRDLRSFPTRRSSDLKRHLLGNRGEIAFWYTRIAPASRRRGQRRGELEWIDELANRLPINSGPLLSVRTRPAQGVGTRRA